LTNGSLAPAVNVTITDAGSSPVSIVDASSRVFDFSSNNITAATLQDLTMNGTASDTNTGGAIHVATISTFTLTVDSCSVTGTNTNAVGGGAIGLVLSNDNLVVTNSTIVGMLPGSPPPLSGGLFGGAINQNGASIIISNSTITGTVSNTQSFG